MATLSWLRRPFALSAPGAADTAATRPEQFIPDLRARRVMLFALALSQAANITSINLMVAVAGGCALLLAGLVEKPPRQWHWRALLLLLTLAAGGLVFQQYGKFIGRDAGIALLFVFGPLKLVEARTTRDFMWVWGLGLMLYVASFFENLGLLAALSLPLVIIVYITVMRLFDAPATAPNAATRDDENTLWAHFRGATAHTLLGIPLAAMLFILFPRATAPLWGMRDTTAGQSGLSEEMRPGQIAKLILSKETAFRVEFEKRKPAQNALYWRGPVLREFDGVTWSVGPDSLFRNRGEFITFTPEEHAREAIEYTVTVERQETRWLPILEMPVAYPSGPAVESTAFLSDAQQIGVRRAPSGATQYRAQSFARGQYTAARPESGAAELRTGPRQFNVRSRAFATELANNHPEPRDRIRALLTLFNREQFFYTLNPPLYGGQRGVTAIDEFLFDGRKGFCEHYAGAMVFVLRASGIPARVVTGYQGGEYHPSGYMIVRQSDAHAWVEAWLDGAWVRIDPTAAVAPNRIERGLQEALPETERLLVNGRGWLSFTGLNNFWEEASFSYTKWIIGFDRDRQRELLKDLGLAGMNPFTALGWMLLAITASGGLIGFTWWLWLKRQERRVDPTVRAWRSLRKRLREAGLEVPAHETVTSAMSRAAVRWPAHADVFSAFAASYNATRFAGGGARATDVRRALAKLPYAYRLRQQ
jgi:transglutaminase-like putative cysteine protease